MRRYSSTGLAILLVLSGCARNDRSLTDRISIDGALTDTRLGVTHFNNGLLASNEFLGVRICEMRVNLTLSANKTNDGHAGLSVSGSVAPGVTAGANASENQSANDQRGNTISLLYRSDNIATCPPQYLEEKATAPTTTNTNSQPMQSATQSSRNDNSGTQRAPIRPAPTADPLKNTCFDIDYRKKNPAHPGESQATWLRRICGPGTALMLQSQ